MIRLLGVVLRSAVAALRSRRELAVENLALRSKADINSGDYMLMPSKMPHAATCLAAGPACIAYLYWEQAVDVTWVNDPPENPNPMPTGS